MAWYMNPKGRTVQLFPTQIDLYFSLFVWSGWFIRLKTFKTQKKYKLYKMQINFKLFQYQGLQQLELLKQSQLMTEWLFNDCKQYAA